MPKLSGSAPLVYTRQRCVAFLYTFQMLHTGRSAMVDRTLLNYRLIWEDLRGGGMFVGAGNLSAVGG